MIQWVINIVWWNWTVYDENKLDKEYAVADVEWVKWYFTSILDIPYTITYNLEWWELSGARTIYTERTNAYVIPYPKKEWYTFEWWTWSNGEEPEINVSLVWRKWNLEFTANWKVEIPVEPDPVTPEPVKPSWNTWWGGGWSSSSNTKKIINNQPKEKEHNSAELTWTTKELEAEQVKQQPTKTNTNTPKESIKQESSATQSSTTTLQSQMDPEILSAYEWAYKHDVTTIPTIDEAMPDGVVKRWHLAKMVVNYATNILWREIPEKIPSECRWNDNRKDWESEEIKDYAVKSCALWLMWLDMPKFLPNLEVTRAQFGTIMSRLLWWKKYAWWTPYYRKHLNALKENNIMTQLENPEKRVELRQWVWLMLMRSAENK